MKFAVCDDGLDYLRKIHRLLEKYLLSRPELGDRMEYLHSEAEL